MRNREKGLDAESPFRFVLNCLRNWQLFKIRTTSDRCSTPIYVRAFLCRLDLFAREATPCRRHVIIKLPRESALFFFSVQPIKKPIGEKGNYMFCLIDYVICGAIDRWSRQADLLPCPQHQIIKRIRRKPPRLFFPFWQFKKSDLLNTCHALPKSCAL